MFYMGCPVPGRNSERCGSYRIVVTLPGVFDELRGYPGDGRRENEASGQGTRILDIIPPWTRKAIVGVFVLEGR